MTVPPRPESRAPVLGLTLCASLPTSARAALPAGGRAPLMAARSRMLQEALLRAVADQRFEEVVDFGPVEDACPGSPWCPAAAPPIHHPPNIDLAVIALD